MIARDSRWFVPKKDLFQKRRSGVRSFIFFVAIIFSFTKARAADVQTQPDDLITASPLAAFSERAGLWPVRDIEDIRADLRPLSETLNTVPGVQARESGSPVVSIRGSAGADRVLSLFDGVPLNLSDGLGASRLFLPEEAVGSIRALRGPSSAYYGSSALGGALDFRAREFPNPAVRVSTVDSGSGIENADRSIFATAHGITGFHARKSGRFPYRNTFGDGERKNGLDEITRLTARAVWRSGQWRFRPLGLIARSVGENPGSLAAPSLSTYSYTGSLVALESTRAFDNDRQLGIRLYDIRQWGLFDRGTTSESSSRIARTAVDIDTRTQIQPGLGARAFVDFKRDSLQATYLGDGSLEEGDAELGGGLEWALTPTLSFQPVIRYLPTAATTIKAAGLIRSDSVGRQWFAYAEGFRRPSLSDRFSNVSYFRGNTALKPERSRAVEAGFSFGEERYGLSLGSTLHTTRYEDLFDTSVLSPGVSTKVNSGRAISSGSELSVGYGFTNLVLKADLSFLDAHNEDTGEPLRLSPKHQSSFSLTRFWRRIAAEARITNWTAFHDRDPTTNSLKELSPWTTLDVSMRTLEVASWEISAGVLNLFDRPRELTYGYPEPQRRVFLSAMRVF